MESRKIFNPLHQLSATASAEIEEDAKGEMQSTSSVRNTKIGVCPKCDDDMGRAVIANNETVYYCEACRVSTPLPDDQIVAVI